MYLRENRYRIFWFATGSALLGLNALLVWLSWSFDFEAPLESLPIRSTVAILLVMALLHLALIPSIPHIGAYRGLLAWVFLVGLTLRAMTLLSTPMLEDDFNRYFWDGALLVHGVNPAHIVPQDVIEQRAEISETVQALAVQSGLVLHRINHPELATCYPAGAAALFALSHLIGPWSLAAWRTVLFGFDLTTFCLLLAILRRLGRSPLYSAIYWWSPLVLKEGFNSAHMDIAILPFVLGAVWLSLDAERPRRLIFSGLLLATGASIKFWPLILVPVLLRPLFRFPKILLLTLSFIAGIMVCQAYFLVAGVRSVEESGILQYGKQWEMNDALFMAILWLCRQPDLISPYADWISRCIVGGSVVLIAFASALQQSATPEQQVRKALWIVAAIFLLSPTQFPWYFLWVMPFLALQPTPSMLLLSATLLIYYLRYYFEGIARVEVFDQGIVWLEYVPVWCLLILECARIRKSRIDDKGRAGACVKI